MATVHLTQDKIIAKIEAEIEAKERADLERLYTLNEEPELASSWQAVGDHLVKEIERPASGRLIHGIASSSTINSHGYALIARGCEADLPVPILWGHQGHGAPIGEVFHVRKSDDRVYVQARLFENEAATFAWQKILAGDARCFSGAAKPHSMQPQGIVAGKTFYGAWELGEVSICEEGANKDSVFDLLRSGDDHRKFFAFERGNPPEPTLPYCGVWKADERYSPGQFVTKGGSLWHAQIETKGIEPGDSPLAWKLVVKRGHAERMKKP